MKITADTNVMLRLVVGDDEAQGIAAVEAFERADLVAIGVHALCELAWVLAGRYAMPRGDIATAIRGLIDAENVMVDCPLVQAGLSVLDAGGDFADGVIAFEGSRLGAETFVSFDRKAVRLLQARGMSSSLLI